MHFIHACTPNLALVAARCFPLVAARCCPLVAARCCPLVAARCRPLVAARCRPLVAARCCPLVAARCRPIHMIWSRLISEEDTDKMTGTFPVTIIGNIDKKLQVASDLWIVYIKKRSGGDLEEKADLLNQLIN